MYFFLSTMWLGLLVLLGFVSTQADVDGVIAATVMGVILVPSLCLLTDAIINRNR